MTRRNDPRTSPERVLKTDADLQELLSLLLRRAEQRQLWLIMLGEDKRIVGPLMPMADHPSTPDELCDTDDIGRVTFAHVLMDRAKFVCEAVGGSALVFVWERPGPERFTGEDLTWARAMAREAEQNGQRLRAQFVLHDDGVRLLTPDDYA